MALRGRRFNDFIELGCLVASGVVGIWFSSTSYQKSKSGWSQQPPTEKVLKSNLRFHDSTTQNFVFKTSKQSWIQEYEWLKYSVVIFQTLESQQPQWPLQPQQPQWPQWPLQPHYIKKITDCDEWIIPGTKTTKTGPFLWNGSPKIQIFTDISTIYVRGCWGQ